MGAEQFDRRIIMIVIKIEKISSYSDFTVDACAYVMHGNKVLHVLDVSQMK